MNGSVTKKKSIFILVSFNYRYVLLVHPNHTKRVIEFI